MSGEARTYAAGRCSVERLDDRADDSRDASDEASGEAPDDEFFASSASDVP
jgi:hypothetical protein